jgi:hypothetical protein
MVVEKLAAMTGGGVEDTGNHLRVAGGQDDRVEVELAFRKRGHGYAALVDGKQVRILCAENEANAFTVAGEALVRLAEERRRLEGLRKERADTEKCLLLLKDFEFPRDRGIRCNVLDGKARLEVRARFKPERIKAFMDMVEMTTLIWEDSGVMSPVDGEMHCNVCDGGADVEIHASFGPERIKAFRDMVEMARLTLEDGDMVPPAEDEDGTFGQERAT